MRKTSLSNLTLAAGCISLVLLYLLSDKLLNTPENRDVLLPSPPVSLETFAVPLPVNVSEIDPKIRDCVLTMVQEKHDASVVITMDELQQSVRSCKIVAFGQKALRHYGQGLPLPKE